MLQLGGETKLAAQLFREVLATLERPDVVGPDHPEARRIRERLGYLVQTDPSTAQSSGGTGRARRLALLCAATTAVVATMLYLWASS